MARPPAKELTERELEIMQVFWRKGMLSVADVKQDLAEAGLDRAYTTIATLVRILADKGFIRQENEQRPFLYRPLKSHEEVSGKLLTDLVERVFLGSREQLLVRLMKQQTLSAKERAALQQILERPAAGQERKP